MELRRHARAQVRRSALAPGGARHLHRLGGGSAPAVAREIAHGAPDDPEEEEVQDYEEAELERDRERLVHCLVELEGQVRHADADLVAWTQRLVVHAPPVHLDPIGGAEVDDLPPVLVAAQLGVPA